MYICKECGAIFDDPDEIVEVVGEFWGQTAAETWWICPSCGDTYFKTAKMCLSCEEYFDEDDLNGGVCDECAEYIRNRVKRFVREKPEELIEYYIEIFEELT